MRRYAGRLMGSAGRYMRRRMMRVGVTIERRHGVAASRRCSARCAHQDAQGSSCALEQFGVLILATSGTCGHKYRCSVIALCSTAACFTLFDHRSRLAR